MNTSPDITPAGEPVTLLAGGLFRDLLERARSAPRRRTNFNFHAGPEENCHRFLNVMMADTYVTPHRHVTPLKPESFVLLEGRAAFFIFNDDGSIRRCDLLDANAARSAGSGTEAPEPAAVGIDVQPGVWHSMIVLSEYAVCFEVKPGPYDPATDKEFAAWAPAEGQPGAVEYREGLRAAAAERF